MLYGESQPSVTQLTQQQLYNIVLTQLTKAIDDYYAEGTMPQQMYVNFKNVMLGNQAYMTELFNKIVTEHPTFNSNYIQVIYDEAKSFVNSKKQQFLTGLNMNKTDRFMPQSRMAPVYQQQVGYPQQQMMMNPQMMQPQMMPQQQMMGYTQQPMTGYNQQPVHDPFARQNQMMQQQNRYSNQQMQPQQQMMQPQMMPQQQMMQPQMMPQQQMMQPQSSFAQPSNYNIQPQVFQPTQPAAKPRWFGGVSDSNVLNTVQQNQQQPLNQNNLKPTTQIEPTAYSHNYSVDLINSGNKENFYKYFAKCVLSMGLTSQEIQFKLSALKLSETDYKKINEAIVNLQSGGSNTVKETHDPFAKQNQMMQQQKHHNTVHANNVQQPVKKPLVNPDKFRAELEAHAEEMEARRERERIAQHEIFTKNYNSPFAKTSAPTSLTKEQHDAINKATIPEKVTPREKQNITVLCDYEHDTLEVPEYRPSNEVLMLDKKFYQDAITKDIILDNTMLLKAPLNKEEVPTCVESVNENFLTIKGDTLIKAYDKYFSKVCYEELMAVKADDKKLTKLVEELQEQFKHINTGSLTGRKAKERLYRLYSMLYPEDDQTPEEIALSNFIESLIIKIANEKLKSFTIDGENIITESIVSLIELGEYKPSHNPVIKEIQVRDDFESLFGELIQRSLSVIHNIKLATAEEHLYALKIDKLHSNFTSTGIKVGSYYYLKDELRNHEELVKKDANNRKALDLVKALKKDLKDIEKYVSEFSVITIDRDTIVTNVNPEVEFEKTYVSLDDDYRPKNAIESFMRDDSVNRNIKESNNLKRMVSNDTQIGTAQNIVHKKHNTFREYMLNKSIHERFMVDKEIEVEDSMKIESFINE